MSLSPYTGPVVFLYDPVIQNDPVEGPVVFVFQRDVHLVDKFKTTRVGKPAK